MKPVFCLLPVLVLAACATPRETCLSEASKDLRIVRSLIEQTQATLDRGYGIQTTERNVVYTDFCVGGGNTTAGIRWCNRTQPVLERTPVALDLSLERRKLTELQAKEALLRRDAADEIQRCELAYPSK